MEKPSAYPTKYAATSSALCIPTWPRSQDLCIRSPNTTTHGCGHKQAIAQSVYVADSGCYGHCQHTTRRSHPPLWDTTTTNDAEGKTHAGGNGTESAEKKRHTKNLQPDSSAMQRRPTCGEWVPCIKIHCSPLGQPRPGRKRVLTQNPTTHMVGSPVGTPVQHLSGRNTSR